MSTMEDRMSRVERTLEAMAEINREMQAETRAMQAETRAVQAETRAMQAETRAMQEDSRAWREARQAEWAAFHEEKRDAQRKWGELANKMGTLVEDIVAPGIPTVFQAVFGLDRLEADARHVRRTHPTDRGREREFDSVVAAGDWLLITETKSTVRPDDIPSFIVALQEARDYLPEAGTRHIVGALAGFSVHASLVAAGERQGLLMFGLGTGLLRVLNTPGFQPARF